MTGLLIGDKRLKHWRFHHKLYRCWSLYNLWFHQLWSHLTNVNTVWFYCYYYETVHFITVSYANYSRTWQDDMVGRAWNSSRPLAIFRPICPIWPSKSDLLGHIYCTFPMEKPLIIYCNVPAFKEWPTNFKLLFQALVGWNAQVTNCYEQ